MYGLFKISFSDEKESVNLEPIDSTKLTGQWTASAGFNSWMFGIYVGTGDPNSGSHAPVAVTLLARAIYLAPECRL